MEHKAFLFTSIPLLGLILVFGYLNIQQEQNLQPVQNSLECQDIEYNGEDRIDILFISSVEDAEHYTQVLFNSEPYKTYRSYFNTRVLPNVEAQCENYRGIAILCYTDSVLELANQ